VIGPDELHDLLHAHAATIDPVPHLAELGAGLTGVERHRRARAVVSTTIAAVAVAAAVTAVRAIESRPSRIDTAPATQRVVIAPDPRVTTATTQPAVPPSLPVTTAVAAADASAAQPASPPMTSPPATTAPPSVAPPATTPAPHDAPTRVLTFRAASVSDLSSSDPPAADYFGLAPPGSKVTAASSYGSASTQAGTDGSWSIHLVMADAPLGERVKVVLSAPPLPALTFNFTHTAG
jgi:hypothetical protein